MTNPADPSSHLDPDHRSPRMPDAHTPDTEEPDSDEDPAANNRTVLTTDAAAQVEDSVVEPGNT